MGVYALGGMGYFDLDAERGEVDAVKLQQVRHEEVCLGGADDESDGLEVQPDLRSSNEEACTQDDVGGDTSLTGSVALMR